MRHLPWSAGTRPRIVSLDRATNIVHARPSRRGARDQLSGRRCPAAITPLRGMTTGRLSGGRSRSAGAACGRAATRIVPTITSTRQLEALRTGSRPGPTARGPVRSRVGLHLREAALMEGRPDLRDLGDVQALVGDRLGAVIDQEDKGQCQQQQADKPQQETDHWIVTPTVLPRACALACALGPMNYSGRAPGSMQSAPQSGAMAHPAHAIAPAGTHVSAFNVSRVP